MGNMILDSLEIKNFRAFSHLKIERLGRVNLITGKNNVGKTCLLEALHLYASNGYYGVIRDLLLSRDEFFLYETTTTTVAYENIKHLFHGRSTPSEVTNPIIIRLLPIEVAPH